MFPALATILAATITGLLAWLAGRKKGGADVQTAINHGFATLIEKLQAERIVLSAALEKQSEKIVSLEAHVEHLEDKIDRMLAAWRRGEPPPNPDNRA